MGEPKTNGVPTVREIASYCGVSQATVSRVLNDNYKNGFSVRREVRQHIIDVADELGYLPNLAAKNLAQRQTKVVGILGCNALFAWPGNLYHVIIDSCVRSLHGQGYDVCITVPNLEKTDSELPGWRIDGAIVLQECSAETIEQMERAGLGYVVVNGVSGPNGSSVIPDDIQGTEKALAHLMDLGHRHIAYAGPTSEHRKHRSIEERHNTYLSELERYGLEPIVGHDKVFRSAHAFLASAVLKERATAILAYDHIEAVKIVQAAHILDIQIPRQVSLICFNDEYMCNIVTPPLTTVCVSSRQMGRVAATMLLEHLQAPSDYCPECVKLSQDLIVRSSTAGPLKK
jgi:LacI family transcriptional regulator